jgi:starch-binding outer membrane protein, SusD/RagB family
MNKNINLILIVALFVSIFSACKDELDVKNPNQPTVASASTETGILSLAAGGVYINGFRGLADKYVDGVPGYFWTGAVGMHSIMGDEIGEEAANWYGNQIGCPNFVTLDNATKLANPQNPSLQYSLLRSVNKNAQQAANPTFHEWANMYSLNNACNNMLALVSGNGITFTGDREAKVNTIKAWAYFWKGFAYSRLGSIYYAGLINNEANKATSNYVTKEDLIKEATTNFDQAISLLGGLKGKADYATTLGSIIPAFCQYGGKVPTTDMWIRNINTMKARNVLVNKTVKSMTPGDYSAVLALTNQGIQKGDFVMVGRSDDNASIWNAESGNIAAKATSASPGENTYKVSERLIQDFQTGDKRLDNNFKKSDKAWIGNADRGTVFNTRYALLDGGAGIAGVVTYSTRKSGKTDIYLAGSYEENELMKAEAKLFTGDLPGCIDAIDAVRTYQGAGLAAIDKKIAAADLEEQLRSERRVALAFQGLAFYDARRLEVIEVGKGRDNCVVIDGKGNVSTKAKIEYGFLDYWDVPDNELAYNPAKSGTTKNPK